MQNPVYFLQQTTSSLPNLHPTCIELMLLINQRSDFMHIWNSIIDGMVFFYIILIAPKAKIVFMHCIETSLSYNKVSVYSPQHQFFLQIICLMNLMKKHMLVLK